MDDVASPPQFKTALQEIEELKEFKQISYMFMVIQALMASALALTNMM